jgi:hypothetical protein
MSAILERQFGTKIQKAKEVSKQMSNLNPTLDYEIGVRY